MGEMGRYPTRLWVSTGLIDKVAIPTVNQNLIHQLERVRTHLILAYCMHSQGFRGLQAKPSDILMTRRVYITAPGVNPTSPAA